MASKRRHHYEPPENDPRRNEPIDTRDLVRNPPVDEPAAQRRRTSLPRPTHDLSEVVFAIFQRHEDHDALRVGCLAAFLRHRDIEGEAKHVHFDLSLFKRWVEEHAHIPGIEKWTMRVIDQSFDFDEESTWYLALMNLQHALRNWKGSLWLDSAPLIVIVPSPGQLSPSEDGQTESAPGQDKDLVSHQPAEEHDMAEQQQEAQGRNVKVKNGPGHMVLPETLNEPPEAAPFSQAIDFADSPRPLGCNFSDSHRLAFTPELVDLTTEDITTESKALSGPNHMMGSTSELLSSSTQTLQDSPAEPEQDDSSSFDNDTTAIDRIAATQQRLFDSNLTLYTRTPELRLRS